MTTTAMITGSVGAVAQREGRPLAESFLSVDAIILVDVSGSMASHDAPDGRSRYKAACDELATIQAANPGKVAVVGFSDRVEFSPGGVPTFQSGGTDMAAALRFVKVADGLGIKLILLSDGMPNDEASTLTVARTFDAKIDTVYIGPERGRGQAFLQRLAAATGGRSLATDEPAMLAAPVQLLLAAA